MPSVRLAILVSSMFAFATLVCSQLHAGDKTTNLHTCDSSGKAPPPLLDTGGKQCCTLRPIWCPDNYCPKCPPCLCLPRLCGGCDCYDAKCPPCLCPPTYCGRCDCYDAKCPPCVNIPCFFPSFYKCPPPACHVTPASKLGSPKYDASRTR